MTETLRVKVYRDLYHTDPGDQSGPWACATETGGVYEDAGPLPGIHADDERGAVAAARLKFPAATEIVVGPDCVDDSPAQAW